MITEEPTAPQTCSYTYVVVCYW